MREQRLFNFNSIERSEDEVTAKGGLILFDRFMKAMNVGGIINGHIPLPCSNRGFNRLY